MLDAFDLPFMQRALVAVLLLAVAGGLLGAWVVLRRLAFFSHAVGTATFPGLVVAAPWGLAAPVAALGSALLFTGALTRVIRDRRLGSDGATGLLVVAFLALGAVLASDVYPAGAGVDRLLFGTLLGLSDTDLWLAAAAAVAALVLTLVLHRSWLAAGFEPQTAPALGVRTAIGDWALLAGIGATVVAMLPAVGALLAATLLVVPAATTRLLARSVPELLTGAVLLGAAEGVVALWIAFELDLPPGPVLALMSGIVFAVVALAQTLAARRTVLAR
ncbi:MAG: metal ABC transporter permease [Solirubrobacteraceae bacterium]|nr:metal ABC transporter permease [Solirubrobacteraceae bacterium]